MLFACGAACVGQIEGQGSQGGTGAGPTLGTGGTPGGNGTPPGGTGGSSAGSGGSTDGTGGASAGSGGSTDGTGGAASGSGGSTSGSGGSASGSGGSTSGSGGATSGSGGATSGSGGSSCVPSSFPPDVQALLSSCSSCHGSTPVAGAPSLVSYANLTAASTSYPGQTNAERAVVRLQSTSNPMPPAGSPRPSATQVSALQAWVTAGYPMTTCPSGNGSGGTNGGGGMGGGGGAAATGGVSGSGGASGSGGSDPFAGPSVCTSKTMWTGGDRGSASMNPGKACITCHRMGEGPTFAVAGTLYPTAHEPDLCNGSNGSTTGARIVITDKNGKALTLTPNAVGNFSYQGTLATPFTASVTYMGRERRMVTPQTNGDCNACHTTSGAMSAPGRILLP